MTDTTMPSTHQPPPAVKDPAHHPSNTFRIGCVSYLNARPLIHNLDQHPHIRAQTAVPSQLLERLTSKQVDIALCPIVDYHRSHVPLKIVPAGAIGCDGPALTVRLFSKLPFNQIQTLHADTDSHTSVVLTQIILSQTYHNTPTILPLANTSNSSPPPDAILLIGDKVITHRPTRSTYPHQLDLGTAWKDLTGLPFIFAAWMARRDTETTHLATTLQSQLAQNQNHLPEIADHYSPQYHWPPALARKYLTRLMKYTITKPYSQAIQEFTTLATNFRAITNPQPIDHLN